MLESAESQSQMAQPVDSFDIVTVREVLEAIERPQRPDAVDLSENENCEEDFAEVDACGTLKWHNEHRIAFEKMHLPWPPLETRLEYALAAPGYIEIQDVTTQWGVFAIAGPKSRDVLAELVKDADPGKVLGNKRFPWLSMQDDR